MFSGDFCVSLNAHGFDDTSPLGHLLWWDTFGVFAYLSLLPVLGLMLFRLSDRDGAVPLWLGRGFQWCALALPAFDCLENELSYLLIRHNAQDTAACAQWVSHAGSYVVGVVSAFKLVAAALLAVTIIICVVRRFLRTRTH